MMTREQAQQAALNWKEFRKPLAEAAECNGLLAVDIPESDFQNMPRIGSRLAFWLRRIGFKKTPTCGCNPREEKLNLFWDWLRVQGIRNPGAFWLWSTAAVLGVPALAFTVQYCAVWVELFIR